MTRALMATVVLAFLFATLVALPVLVMFIGIVYACAKDL